MEAELGFTEVKEEEEVEDITLLHRRLTGGGNKEDELKLEPPLESDEVKGKAQELNPEARVEVKLQERILSRKPRWLSLELGER